ncbi:MAG TPA: polysaccharide deacetylase family protein [Candidatus Limnocylindria bacterium]|nr:polysaccharide deacetylase family protein [Candidatus Limnocylindria bacterium]
MKAALSLDLDNKWSYLKTHGDPAWKEFPSYLDVLVPRVLEILARERLRITFFIVGQDAALPRHADALASIAAAGHEIGNHSHYHEPWMHRRDERAIDEEFALAEESIACATGRLPRGFRGPGFVRSQTMLATLVRRGYAYDASSLPTFIGPFARAYYFRTAKLGAAEMRERHDLFGQFSDGFLPNRRHRVRVGDTSIAEVPVTTFPGLRLPIHISYVLYIAAVSPRLAMHYFRGALRACKLTGTEPSILLHPLDFLCAEDCPELGFFPAMNLPLAVKLETVLRALRALTAEFEVHPVGDVV